MKTKEDIINWIEENYPDESVLLADGLEDAFIGIAYQFNTAIAIYDKQKCIDIFVNDGMSYEEANEYFDFNVQGAYVGEKTPAFLDLY
jgi:hypothetical protein